MRCHVLRRLGVDRYGRGLVRIQISRSSPVPVSTKLISKKLTSRQIGVFWECFVGLQEQTSGLQLSRLRPDRLLKLRSGE